MTIFVLFLSKVNDFISSFGSNSSVATAISNIAARFTEEYQLEKLMQFNVKHNSRFGSSLEATVKSVVYNLEWSKAKMGPVKAYFVKLGTGGATINTVSIFSIVVVALLSIIFQ